MTKREAAIVTLYTGLVCVDFNFAHELAEELIGEPIFTHQFGNKEFAEMIKEKVKPLFITLEVK